MRQAITAMERLERSQYENYNELGIDSYSSFIDSDFSWACDTCLETKNAISAQSSLQKYSWNPHYAYYDSTFQCQTCQESFKFKKEEKKLWYEKLKFHIDSEPANCLSCRKDLRTLKNENTLLSNILLNNVDELTQEDIIQVIDIYKKWGKVEKVKYYQSLLKT